MHNLDLSDKLSCLSCVILGAVLVLGSVDDKREGGMDEGEWTKQRSCKFDF
jgi:hypothetical protein